MGFYAPAQIVRDAREHGVEIPPVCINRSRWDCTLDANGDDGCLAVRLGMRQVRGLSNAHAATIVAASVDEAFTSADNLWRRSRVPVSALVRLAEADAFLESLGLARREALWAIKALRDEPLPLFAAADARDGEMLPEVIEEDVAIKPLTAGGEVVADYSHVGLTLRAHPVSFLREKLVRMSVATCANAAKAADNRFIKVAGIVLVRQKPGSAKGVMFITIEDETGVSNLVIWPTLYEKQRRVILGSSMLLVDGRIQREGDVVHLVAYKLTDLSGDLAGVGEMEGAFPLRHGRGDEAHHGGGPDARDAPKVERKIPPARDIYIPDLHLDTIKVKTRDFR